MSVSRIKNVGFWLLFLSTLLATACHDKKQLAPPPPLQGSVGDSGRPTPTTPAPTITLRATPGTIDRGGTTTLEWEARNAATVTITPGVGEVAVTGSRPVNPTSSVTYTASATGPGGTTTDVARVTVNVPAVSGTDPNSGRPPGVTATGIDGTNGLKDVLFDYDKADIRPDQVAVLQSNVAALKGMGARFTIEGHCDERGSEEYNLGLGDRRANAVKEFLLGQGIPANRINVVSYGEERPVCRDETEECYTKNRRAHFAVTQ